jgi:hypothetical protein
MSTTNDGRLLTAPKLKLPFLVHHGIVRPLLWTVGQAPGDRKDNATFLHDADKDHRDRPARAQRFTRAKWRRVVRRNTLVTAPLVLGSLAGADHVLNLAPDYLMMAQAYGLGVGLSYTAWASWWVSSYRAWLLVPRLTRSFPFVGRGHLSEYIRPAAEVLASQLDQRYVKVEATRAVQLPKGFPDAITDEAPVVLTLPNRRVDEGKDPARGKRAQIVNSVGARLGMPTPRATWHEQGKYLRVTLVPAVKLAQSVSASEFLKLAADADPLAPVLGFGEGGRPVHMTHRSNAPHSANTADTGKGKSTLYRGLLAQFLRAGEAVLVIDCVKRGQSHRWLQGLPRTRTARTPEQAHDALVSLNALMAERYDELNRNPDARFIPVHVVMEEANATAPELMTFWEILRAADKTLPTKSPAVYGMRQLVFAGREVSMHVHYIGQRLSAQVFGPQGGDVRENFPNALMAGWKMPTWKMWAAGHAYQAFPTREPVGLWAQVTSAGVEWFRTPHLSNEDARSLALGSAQFADDFWGPEFGALRGGAQDARIVDSTARVADERALMTLGELSAELSARGEQVSVAQLKQMAAPNGPRSVEGWPPPAGKRGNANLYPLSDVLRALKVPDNAAELTEGEPMSWGMVYGLFVDGIPQVAYVGKSRRPRGVRTDEHREDKAWGDLIVGEVVLWEGECSDGRLHDKEMSLIKEVKPLYNWEGQEAAAHYVPYRVTYAERHARDDAAGRPRWVDPKRGADVPVTA